MAEILYAESMGRPAENFALLDKICNFRYVIYSLSTFSIGCRKTPWSDAPSLVSCF